MSTPVEKFVSEALDDFKKALRAEGKVGKKRDAYYERAAEDFAHYLGTGRLLKRDERYRQKKK